MSGLIAQRDSVGLQHQKENSLEHHHHKTASQCACLQAELIATLLSAALGQVRNLGDYLSKLCPSSAKRTEVKSVRCADVRDQVTLNSSLLCARRLRERHTGVRVFWRVLLTRTPSSGSFSTVSSVCGFVLQRSTQWTNAAQSCGGQQQAAARELLSVRLPWRALSARYAVRVVSSLSKSFIGCPYEVA